MSSFKHLPSSSRHPLHGVAILWHSLLEHVFHPYRPELYYMRGPGPKWRAKHARG